YLVEVHARPLRRSCECVGLSPAAWYRPPLDWTVRDAELIAALAELVEDHPGWGFWKCCKFLRRRWPEWNHKRIYRVYKAMNLHHGVGLLHGFVQLHECLQAAQLAAIAARLQLAQQRGRGDPLGSCRSHPLEDVVVKGLELGW